MKVDLKYLILVAGVAYAAYAAYTHGPRLLASASTSGLSLRGDVVMIDPVRIVNAQRAVASLALAGDSDILADTSVIGRQLERTIQTIAEGRLVIVRQAIVTNHELVPDITDQVLAFLELPTEVPTVDPVQSRLNFSGTNFRNSSIEDVLEDNMQQRKREWSKQSREAENDLLP